MKFVPLLAVAAALMAVTTASLAQAPEPVTPPPALPGPPAPPAPPAEFTVCNACHETTAAGGPTLGPNLFAIGGRKAGSHPGYDYSDGMKASDLIWDAATLQAFILDPAKSVPGNKMDYPGASDPETAKAIADYLMTLKN